MIPAVRCIRVVDRDTYTKEQAARPSQAGRPKAVVLAERLRTIRPELEVEPVVGDIECLPLGMFHCGVLLTALDSKRARIIANYAFAKLGIRYWVDSGVSAPSLARVSVFSQGKHTPCYECGLDQADYASEQSYPCQPASAPPPTNSPEYLGALAASLQAAECVRLLSGQIGEAHLNCELVYDISSRRLFVTHLTRQTTCRSDHGAFVIRHLRHGPRRLTVGDAFALNAGRAKPSVNATLEVPGKLFVRQLACRCGRTLQVLRLKGRFASVGQGCPGCGGRMLPMGTGLSNVLAREALSPRELARPLSTLGLQQADVISLGKGSRLHHFELGSD
jgi:molybdopterin/thiamine biosynthesis adenylyltransferase